MQGEKAPLKDKSNWFNKKRKANSEEMHLMVHKAVVGASLNEGKMKHTVQFDDVVIEVLFFDTKDVTGNGKKSNRKKSNGRTRKQPTRMAVKDKTAVTAPVAAQPLILVANLDLAQDSVTGDLKAFDNFTLNNEDLVPIVADDISAALNNISKEEP